MIKEFFLSAEEKYRLLGAVLKTGKKFLEDDCFTLGAAISFFAAFSLFPLLILVISLFAFLLASGFPLVVNFKAELIRIVSNFNLDIAEFLERSVNTAMETRRLAGATGLIFLFIAGAGFFEHVTLALDRIWDVPHERSFLKRKFISWLVFLIMIVLLFFFNVGKLLLGVLISQLLKSIGSYAWLNWLYFFSYFALAFLLFFLTYRFLPAIDVTWKSAFWGSIVATFSVSFFNWAFSIYIRKVNLVSIYGPVGVGLLFLLWIYLFSLSLLLGGEVSSVIR
jgi:membrane protein